MRKLLAVTAAAGALAASVPTLALAANPPGTGRPSQDCTMFSATTRPGNSGSSPGSVFNEPGINSMNGGTGGAAYNNAGAPSQYDVACFQASQH